MGYPDRLREEGKTEEEIAAVLADGAAVERPQDPETARVSYDTEPVVGEPYVAPPPGDAGVIAEGDEFPPPPEEEDEEDVEEE